VLAAAAIATGCGGDGGEDEPRAPAAAEAVATVDRGRFDGAAALGWVRRQVEYGPRPAGSKASRRLAKRLREALPNGTYQAVPGGLRNVIGTVPGRRPGRVVVVGAHYDTKDLPRFVGANDGASGTAVVRQLARQIRARQLRPTVIFVFFDGEEAPRGVPDSEFERHGLRGSRVAAPTLRHAEAAIVLDFVGDRRLAFPRERNSDRVLWNRLRQAAARVGYARHFPAREQGSVLDDHVPFIRAGVPAIDLIDFDFPCWHRRCDNLSAVAPRSLDATGETVLELLRSL
jgi:glutaminyl-peptide cyclotransferase